MRVYDPRDKQWKQSNNPALMIAQFMMPESLPQTVGFRLWLHDDSLTCDTCSREARQIGKATRQPNGEHDALSIITRHGREAHGVVLSIREAIPQPIADQIQIVMHVDKGIGPRREPAPINWEAVAEMADYCDQKIKPDG